MRLAPKVACYWLLAATSVAIGCHGADNTDLTTPERDPRPAAVPDGETIPANTLEHGPLDTGGSGNSAEPKGAAPNAEQLRPSSAQMSNARFHLHGAMALGIEQRTVSSSANFVLHAALVTKPQ